MSMPRGMKITCPDCQKEGNFTIWHSINVDVDPETREKVKSGELFEYTCKNCGKKNLVEYRFLYHDMENKFLIWYFPKHDYDINKEILEVNSNTLHGVMKERVRIVDTRNDLLEKIFIFENHLNDIVVEIIKDIIRQQLEDKNINIFFNKLENDTLCFWLSNNKGVGFPLKGYNEILQDSNVIEPDECLLINRNTHYKYWRKIRMADKGCWVINIQKSTSSLCISTII